LLQMVGLTTCAGKSTPPCEALVNTNTICRPHFDSPSVFCRILDQEKGGHFTVSPTSDDLCTTKQQYLPASNILQTRYLKEDGVMNLLDCT
jgi:GH15 family glucan-1,4-alpha-glucosidase